MAETTYDRLVSRSQFLTLTRNFFNSRSYLEVDTPNIVVSPGTEAYLEYFETNWEDHPDSSKKALKRYLRSSPEIHLKKALGLGAPNVFQIASCYRNGGEISDWHSPEFLLLEFYRSNCSLDNFLLELEEYIKTVFDQFKENAPTISNKISNNNPLKLSVFEAFKEFAGIELIDEDDDLARKAVELKFPFVKSSDDFETAYFKILLNIIEPQLKKLGFVFLVGYPPSQAALSKIENQIAQRFEVYLEGIELANGFVELQGSQKNLGRIIQSNLIRTQLDKSQIPVDHSFLEACDRFPPCIGVALGLERLLALALGCKNIRETMPLYDSFEI